jgi:hypothetical protein
MAQRAAKLKDSLSINLQPAPFNGEPNRLGKFLRNFHVFYDVKGTLEWETRELERAEANRLITLGVATLDASNTTTSSVTPPDSLLVRKVMNES